MYFAILQAETDLRVAQAEFDRQAEITKLLLEGVSSTHVSLLLMGHYLKLICFTHPGI